MMSMTGFSSIPGSIGVRTAIEKLGTQRSIMFGLLLSIVANVSACSALHRTRLLLRCGQHILASHTEHLRRWVPSVLNVVILVS